MCVTNVYTVTHCGINGKNVAGSRENKTEVPIHSALSSEVGRLTKS